MKKIKLLALLSVLISSIIYSDIKLDGSKSQNTIIEQGKKGNTIININTPNGKGVSVNDFENFQTKNGVVFNNSGQRMNISQLEGIINGNPNITGDQAKLILNRVNGTNRTEIEGAMEAVGRNKVDMIFSSPNGIYLNGAKFIGFKDVTFTTAPVNLDGEGNIQTLTIDKGDIEVGRKGLDASKLEQLALLSKQISIDGEIRGKNLNFIAGDFDYNVNDKSYVNKEVENTSISISSSELGSIYGDQINIIATNGEIGIKGDLIVKKINVESKNNITLNNIETEKINIKFEENLNLNGTLHSQNTIYIKKEGWNNNGILTVNGNIQGNNFTLSDSSMNYWGNHKNYGEILINNKIFLDGRLFNYGLLFSENLAGGFNSSLLNYEKIIISGNIDSYNGERKYKIFVENYKNMIVMGNMDVHQLNLGGKDSIIEIGGDLVAVRIQNSFGTVKIGGQTDVYRFSNTGGRFQGNELKVEDGGGGATFYNLLGGTVNLKNANIKINSDRSFINEGVINVLENMDVSTYKYISEYSANNSGIINSRTLKLDFINFINKGILVATEDMIIKSEKIVNKGEINTKTLNLIFKDLHFQDGKITADKTIFELYK